MFSLNQESKFKLNPTETEGKKIITLSNDWSTITGDFTGVIDGNDTIIKNYKMALTQNPEDESEYYMAFVENNLGTIKNITFELVGSGTKSQQSYMSIATIAIINKNTIENVTVNGATTYVSNQVATDYHLYVETNDDSTDGVKVGGLVVENQGTINNVEVNINIYAIGTSDKIVNSGGIAYRATTGAIRNSAFTGNITGNYVGGIVYWAYNAVEITNCTVGSSATPSILTGQAYYGNNGKYVYMGGLIGKASTTRNQTLTITNCNAYVEFKLDVKTGASKGMCYIGGFISVINSGSSDRFVKLNSCTVDGTYTYIGSALVSELNTKVKVYEDTPSNNVSTNDCNVTKRPDASFGLWFNPIS